VEGHRADAQGVVIGFILRNNLKVSNGMEVKWVYYGKILSAVVIE
jgi:hypothetical protein